jgi:hypothetical protein
MPEVDHMPSAPIPKKKSPPRGRTATTRDFKQINLIGAISVTRSRACGKFASLPSILWGQQHAQEEHYDH